MKKIVLPISLFTLLFITACGASHEDQVAAKEGCLMIERYKEMQSTKGTEKVSVAEEMFFNAKENYEVALEYVSNPGNIEALMEESCPGAGDVLNVIAK